MMTVDGALCGKIWAEDYKSHEEYGEVYGQRIGPAVSNSPTSWARPQ